MNDFHTRISVSHLCTEPLGTVRVAFVGLGDRGQTALRLMLPLPEAQITALCDVSTSCARKAAKFISQFDSSRPVPPIYSDYTAVCSDEHVDLVYICSDWTSHAEIAVNAMLAGKHVAVEVPAALTLDDIWRIVLTAEKTRRHCFLLENCCFDPRLQAAISDIQNGSIGKPVHAEGSYYHHLNDRWTPWRLDINRRQRGDLYPTHELAPLCMALGDDHMQTLVCMDSAPFSGPDVHMQQLGTPAPDFQNGDHTTTLIRTAGGRTILLRHDVLTLQPYQRRFSVIGTRGSICIDDNGSTSHDEITTRMNDHLIHSLANGLPLCIDVYDLAEWCAVIPLSQQSIEQGFAPVVFPSFRP